MKNNLRLKLKEKRVMLFVFVIILFGCKRIEKAETAGEYVENKVEISSKEMQRILTTKANLQSVLVSDNLQLSIPENYYFRTRSITKDDLNRKENIGDLDLTEKDSYDYVEIINSLFSNNEISDESITIVKDENPNLLTIADLKADYAIETVYFEDKNSIVFSEDKIFTTLHFQYDLKAKSYLIYSGTISWSKEFSKEDKLDLAFFFLRNAKNLLSNNLKKQDFSWKDYVDNRPKIEINLMKYYFKNFKKEMDAFLDVGETSIPKYDQHSMVELFRMPANGDVVFYQYVNNIAAGKFEEAKNIEWARDLFYTDEKCTVTSKGNSSIVEITGFNYKGEMYAQEYMVFSIIDYDKKLFLLKTEKNLNEKATDFYAKMFDYYSQNLTLDLVKNK